MNTFAIIVLIVDLIYLGILTYTTIDDWKKIGFDKNDIPVLMILVIPLILNIGVCIGELC